MRQAHTLSLNEEQEKKLQDFLSVKYYSMPYIFMEGLKAIEQRRKIATGEAVKK